MSPSPFGKWIEGVLFPNGHALGLQLRLYIASDSQQEKRTICVVRARRGEDRRRGEEERRRGANDLYEQEVKERRREGEKEEKEMEVEIREVWRQNIAEELKLMWELVGHYRFVAVDTEFPGFLRSTPRYASEEERYRDLKSNVDSMKVIQLGIAMFDDQGNMPFSRCCCWQFNFSDFDPAKDAHSEASLELLKRSGIDFDKMRCQGVEADVCSIMLQEVLRRCCHETRWITFHGLYDVAYLLKLLTRAPLPDTLHGFLILARSLLGRCYDVKYIARFCEGLLGGETSLVKMSKMMGIELPETCHQAGYGCLLAGLLFWEIKRVFRIDEDKFVGILYGMEVNCINSSMTTAVPSHPCRGRRLLVAPPFGYAICTRSTSMPAVPFHPCRSRPFLVAPPFGYMICFPRFR